MEENHQRRVRYKGTHPRNFKEKYKELQPDKYGDTIEKVIRKGGTPAGMHISICVEEILEFLQIQPGQKGLDATLGYGGHTGRIETTTQFRQVIEKALEFLPKEERAEVVKKSCQRSFQALRIDVNNEYEVLYDFLEKLPDVLAPGGRAAILTFHSREDRLVKKSFQRLYKEGIYSDYSKEVIRPSAQECIRNSRTKSTKIRWAVKALYS